jgi:hypothetical protein
MSTATIPFTFRNGYFPGIADGSIPSGYGSVDLTSIGGDAGLSEAIRIWWMAERITFTPSGTATAGTATATFAEVFQAPDALNTGSSSTGVKGSIAASNSFISFPASTKEPALRGIIGSTYSLIDAAYLDQNFVTDPDDQEGGRFVFSIKYDGSKWVLYYTFGFYKTNYSGVNAASIAIESNPAIATGTAGPTGTVDFFGYSLAWNSAYIVRPSGSASGIGLALSYDEWTL